MFEWRKEMNDLTLSAALEHLDDILQSKEEWKYEECKNDHITIRGFLQELKQHREIGTVTKCKYAVKTMREIQEEINRELVTGGSDDDEIFATLFLECYRILESNQEEEDFEELHEAAERENGEQKVEKQAKEEIKEIWKAVKRQGADKLLQHMEESGFFTAPASTKYHGCYEGGLAEHSLNVLERIVELQEWEKQRNIHYIPYRTETLIIVAILHDICKMDMYEETKEGSYRYTNSFPVGHGEKSVFKILQYIYLTDEEIMAIRWHMGQFDYAAKGGCRDLNNAFMQSKLVVMLHIADMMATHIDE